MVEGSLNASAYVARGKELQGKVCASEEGFGSSPMIGIYAILVNPPSEKITHYS